MPASTSAPSVPLDTTLRIVSPENISFDFRLAGPAHRVVAFIIDAVVIVGCCTAILVPLTLTGLVNALIGFVFIGIFFVWWGYGAVLETFNNGQTLGKLALGLRTVSQTGLSINVSQAVLRNLLRTVDIAPPFFPGFLSMALTRQLQRLGDLAAGTVVVIDGRSPAASATWADGGPNLAADLVPAGFIPDPVLAEALAEYVARRPVLPIGRRYELATIPVARLCEAWRIPPAPDPDALVCAVHDRTFGGKSP